MNSAQQSQQEQEEHYQPIVFSVPQSKHDQGERDQPILNSVRIVNRLHQPKHE